MEALRVATVVPELLQQLSLIHHLQRQPKVKVGGVWTCT
jgi:hypothetical protein